MNPAELLDRMPPQSLGSEQALIGSVLLDPRCLNEVCEIVRPEDFYADGNKRLFGAIVALDANRQKIDSLLLIEALRKTGHLEEVGGVAHIAVCAGSAPHASNAIQYAKIIAEKSALRNLIAASTDTLREAYDGREASQAILDRAEQRLQQCGCHRTHELQSAHQLAIEVGDFVDDVVERGKHIGLPTGLPEFDSKIGGLFGGEFIVLAARPSVGKSALACQMADYAASTGRLVYVASLEMTGRELAMRSICTTVRVNSRAIRTGRLTGDDRGRLVEGMLEYSRRQLVVDVRYDITVEGLARTIRRLISKGLALAVVDYLGLLTPSDKRQNRHEQVSHQTRALKLLAREVQIPLLVLCQLNRATMEDAGPPQLHNLRESGSVEQDADVVLFIHRPDGGIMLPDPNDRKKKIKAEWPAELIIGKQRNGATGRIKLGWEPQYTRFSCFDWQEAADEFSEFATPEEF